MGMKNFLKQFVAAFGGAAGEELDKKILPIPALDPFHETSGHYVDGENDVSCDHTAFPAGYDNWGIDEEP